jgi:hypothetical protein
MKVGMGYSIHMKSDAELLYPYGLGKTKAVASGNSMPKIRHYMLANNTTGRNATLLLKNVVDHSQAVPDSSEIGVYDADGLLVGAGVVMGGRSALTLWGDNEMTKGKDGLSVSEHMTFKVWTPSGEEYPATYSGTNSNGYADNAIMVGTLSINRALVITRCALSNAYPNPFRGTVRIAFDVAAINNKDMQNVEVTIYDLRGTQVCQLVRGIYKTGRYSVIWDSRGNTGSNVYIVMMKTENFTQRMKLFKVK